MQYHGRLLRLALVNEGGRQVPEDDRLVLLFAYAEALCRLLRGLAAAPAARAVPVPRLVDGLVSGRPRSPIETALLRACIAGGLPKAEAQKRFIDYGPDGQEFVRTVPDFAWSDQQVAVYCDGWEFHSAPEQRAADAQRRAWLERQGWRVLAFWGREIVNQPEHCVGRIASALQEASR
jgi:hypothetical protein